MKNYALIEKSIMASEIGNVSMSSIVREQYIMAAVPTFTRTGLERLVEGAVDSFTARYGSNILPWNLVKEGPYRGLSRYSNLRIDMLKNNPVEECAKFVGWLRVAQDDDVLMHFIKKTQTERGMGSPYNYGSMWDIIRRHSSPGGFRKWILSVRSRADQILKPYGFKCSYYGLGHVAADGPMKIGKAAFRAAALTLDLAFSLTRGFGIPSGKLWNMTTLDALKKYVGLKDLVTKPRSIRYLALSKWEKGGYKTIKELMASMDIYLDTTDGVEMWIDRNAAPIVDHGVKIYMGAAGGAREEESVMFLYRLGDMTYHSRWMNDTKMVVKEWKKRRALEKQFNGSLIRDDRTILIWKEDSIASGNCRFGTEAFMDRYGVKRNFVPASWLLKHSDNPSVSRVLRYVGNMLLDMEEHGYLLESAENE